MAAAARPANFSGSGQVVTGPGVYQGLSVRGDAAFTVRVWDGTGASGPLLAVAQSPGAGSVIDTPAAGIFFGAGVFVEVVAGTVQGSVRI